jgi:hypothetical protein
MLEQYDRPEIEPILASETGTSDCCSHSSRQNFFRNQIVVEAKLRLNLPFVSASDIITRVVIKPLLTMQL